MHYSLSLMQSSLSVIVPVYNTEQYLRRCLDSLVAQTLEDIEIIVVNDSSQDNSQLIIDEYCTKYPQKIFSYIKPNGGLSSARNYGVQKSRGKYLAFVDSDDWVDLGLFAAMIVKATSNDSEIVCCNVLEKYSSFDKLRQVQPDKNYDNVYLGNELAWNKVYKSSFWRANDFRFMLDIYHEDLELVPRIMSVANKISYIDDQLYFYERRNLNSITGGRMLHLKYFETILDSLGYWSCSRLKNSDFEFKKFIANIAYIYVMLISNSHQAYEVFCKYQDYFEQSLLLNKRRKRLARLLKINFIVFHRLNLLIKKLKKHRTIGIMD